MGMVRRVTDEHGAILLELLVAMALFLAVLVPLIHLLVRTAATDRATDLVLATHLARGHLEILRRNPSLGMEQSRLTLNGRTYRIVREVQKQGALLRLTVGVYRGEEGDPLVRLALLVYYGGQG